MEDIQAVKNSFPDAVEQKLGNLTRIVRFEGASDDNALSFYYSDPADAWRMALVNCK